jgi:hypothetical protein
LLPILSVAATSTAVRAQDAPPVPAAATPAAQDPATPAPVTPIAPADAAAAPQEPPVADPPPAAPVPATTLRVTVRNAQNGALIPNAAVRLESETERSRSRATDISGLAFFPRIPAGNYNVIVQAINFATTTVANVTIAPGQVNNVDVQMVVRIERIDIFRVRELIDPNDTSISVRRDQEFFRLFPLNAGNRQDTNRLLLSVPGVARDVFNRVVPRGEDNVAQSSYVDGIQAPQRAQGSLASFLVPDALDGFRAITGGFAPQYGGGSGLILESDLRDPPARLRTPFLEGTLRAGEYATTESYFAFGSRIAGRGSKGAPPGTIPRGRSFGYTVVGSQRYTDNVAETAQNGGATIHNYGASEVFFGRFDFQVTPAATMKAIVNFSSGRSDLNNRLGLPEEGQYLAFGQGFGFLGTSPRASGLPSQQTAGQRLYQKDNSNFVLLQFDRQLRSGAKARLSVGSSISDVAQRNRTFNTFGTTALPANNSVEYLPFVRQNYDQLQTQFDFTPRVRGKHQTQMGVVYHDLIAQERYQYIPQSQLAAAALFQVDPRLATQTLNGSTFSPLLSVRREGYYAAGYLQDTFKFRPTITVNYGLRMDAYSQAISSGGFDTSTGQRFGQGSVPRVNQTEFSPRLNVAISFPQGSGAGTGRLRRLYRLLSSQPTVARVAYNRLFAPPGLGQGAYLGNQPQEGSGGTRFARPVLPQVTDQFDVSLERQFGGTRVARIGLYNKDVKNYLQMEQLIPGLQSGMLAVFNQGNAQVDGAEITFEMLPASNDGSGVRAFLVYGSSTTRPANRRQRNNAGGSLGATIPGTNASFLETAQEDTMTLGVSYQTTRGASAGLSVYYGSGLYASALRPAFSPQRVAGRQTINEVNLRLSTGPRFLNNRATLQVEVENLTDSRARMSFQGAFAGTRFQQGRRIFATIGAKY